MEDLGKEVDEYFAKKYPLETKKLLCHQCGGAVDNSTQQLKAAISLVRQAAVDYFWDCSCRDEMYDALSIIEKRAAV